VANTAVAKPSKSRPLFQVVAMLKVIVCFCERIFVFLIIGRARFYERLRRGGEWCCLVLCRKKSEGERAIRF
jgi:hypothetical protein